MLGKLLKYDLRAMGKILFPLMIAVLVVSVVLGINLRSAYDAAAVPQFTVILVIGLFLCLFLIFFLAFIMTIHRFRHHLLGNEGYLSFALPVTTLEHLLSKYLASLACFLLATAVAWLSVNLIVRIATPAIIRMTSNEIVRQMMDSMNIQENLPIAILTAFASVSMEIFHLYLSMSVGHLWSGHTTLGAILCYVAISICSSTLMAHLPLHSINSTILYQFCAAAVFAVLSWFILDRKLNME